MNINRRKIGNNFNQNNPYSSLKFLLLLAIFFILFFPLISAVEISMDSEFASGENLLAKISGNFIDQITRDNIFFYRGHVQIPIIYDVVKIEDEFYIYAILTGKSQGNYSLSIEGIRYYKATQIVSDALVSNFSISNETAVFSVNPGIVSTKDDFLVELWNLQDRKIIVEINENSPYINSETSLELKSGEKKNLFFGVMENAEKGIVNIEFSSESFSYILPVYLDTNKISNKTKDFEMKFQPSSAEVSMATNSESKKILYLTNIGNETIEDIFFDISPSLEQYIIISPEKINSLKSGNAEKIEISISSDLEEAIIEGEIIAFTETLSASLNLILNFTEGFIPAAPEEEDLAIVTLCEDLNGVVCESNLECSGDIVRSKNGDCCIAPLVCQQPKKSSSGKWIGWGLLILAFAFLYWFYKKKYKGVARRKAF